MFCGLKQKVFQKSLFLCGFIEGADVYSVLDKLMVSGGRQNNEKFELNQQLKVLLEGLNELFPSNSG